ncbi:MAG TPA: alpha/beta hydrolase [Candidatus Methylacidiphilales bacterium]|nr:alpha/beta hydrolase [Candidatus Methylacidiphilales bacterium]
MTRKFHLVLASLFLVVAVLPGPLSYGAGNSQKKKSSSTTTSTTTSASPASVLTPPNPLLEAKAAERLAAVELAWNEMASARASKSAKVVKGTEEKYRKAVDAFLIAFAQMRKMVEWKGVIVLTHKGRTYHLEIPAPPAGYTQWNVLDFDSIRVASSVKIKSMSRPTRIEGLGAPVVLRKHSQGEPYVFRSGYNVPGTAVIDFETTGGGPVRTVLRFYDPREISEVDGLTLSADFAAAVEIGINLPEFRDIEFGGVFAIQKFMKVTGLYVTEPYRPDKIPVIFVHGLNSSPLTWTQMLNDINADTKLSRKYQYWYYSYPTGTGWIISAPKLREQLNGADAYFSAKGGRNNLSRCILVGHSMGGVMSRMMCIDSGNDFWDRVFKKPPEQVEWPTPQARQTVTSMLFFKKVPIVSAAIFIAAPHRGSGIADWPVVGLIKKLIRLPIGLATTVLNVATLNVEALKITIKEGAGFGTSISGLSPKNPGYIALNNRVIQVPFYTIIGDHNSGGDLLKYPDPVLLRSNDTVVPYWSSHLNEAVSETIVHAKHTICTTYNGSVEQVKRILSDRLAGKLGRAPTKPAGQYGPDETPEKTHEKLEGGKPVKMKSPALDASRTDKPVNGKPPEKPMGRKSNSKNVPTVSEPAMASAE